jgi:hypothetical protein
MLLEEHHDRGLQSKAKRSDDATSIEVRQLV